MTHLFVFTEPNNITGSHNQLCRFFFSHFFDFNQIIYPKLCQIISHMSVLEMMMGLVATLEKHHGVDIDKLYRAGAVFPYRLSTKLERGDTLAVTIEEIVVALVAGRLLRCAGLLAADERGEIFVVVAGGRRLAGIDLRDGLRSLQLAFRELKKIKPEDLDKLMRALAALRGPKEEQ